MSVENWSLFHLDIHTMTFTTNAKQKHAKKSPTRNANDKPLDFQAM